MCVEFQIIRLLGGVVGLLLHTMGCILLDCLSFIDHQNVVRLHYGVSVFDSWFDYFDSSSVG